MEKFRFGTKETVATLCGLALFVIAEWIEVTMISKGIIPAGIYQWVQLRVLVVAAVAVFFGPVSGVFCGVGGDLPINVIFEAVISYPEVMVLGIYGIFMGMYYGKMHYEPAKFGPREWVDFNAVQIFAGIFCALFFAPMTKYFIERVSIYDSVRVGAKSALGNSVLIGLILPIAMAIVGVVKRKEEAKSRQSDLRADLRYDKIPG